MPMQYINRRRFLELGIAAGAATAAAPYFAGGVLAGSPKPKATSTTKKTRVSPLATVPETDRLLVLIEMDGGADGMSMAPPRGATYGRYHDLRSRIALAEADTLQLTPDVGFHPALAKLFARYQANAGIGIVAGVGISKPDLSHFEMLRRWWAGDHTSADLTPTGFLGRLCDAVAERDGTVSAPAIGVSLGYGPTPSLVAVNASTLSVNPYDDGGFPVFWDTDMDTVWKASWKTMCEVVDPKATVPFIAARHGAAYARLFADDVMAQLGPGGNGYPTDADLGVQLALAARMLAADKGVRIVHVPYYGDFDTHNNHVDRFAAQMTLLDNALDAFLADLESRGIADKVLVATMSEFGRRVADNDSNGLDHGAASFSLIAGAPAATGIFGQYPAFASDSDLDPDGNLVATVDMWELYATLATWMGIPGADLGLGSASAVPGVLLS
jgi:uncharacterized protein (DUF1501 family)